MQQITNWIVDGLGHIRGDLVGTEKAINTSTVVKREGSIVTTRSGSQYELVDPPNAFLTDNRALNFHWDKATSPLDAVDKMIQRQERLTQTAKGE